MSFHSRSAILSVILLSSILLAPESAQSLDYVLKQSYVSPNPVSGARFGYSVAITGDNVFVGAPFECCPYGGNASKKGRVYQFDVNGAWIRTIDHPNPLGVVSTTMGQSIAADGSFLVVGDNLVTVSAFPFSALGEIFVFDANTGSLMHTLFPPVFAHATRFGSVVAISGTNILAGAFNALGGIGEAYLFDAASGAHLRTFSNPSPDIGDWFGVHVAIDGNLVLVGASRDDTTSSDGGAAYLFDATSGALLQSFFDPTPATGNQFGLNVAIHAGRALIYNADFEYHVFDVSTGAHLQTILTSGCVQISAIQNDDAFAACINVPNGAIRVFDAASGLLKQTIENPTATPSDFFGFGMDADLDNLIVGARFADAVVVDDGAAYLYALEGSDSDGDGVPDDVDMCPGGDDNVDTDMDGVADFCDPCPNDDENDADGDGVCGDVDICIGGDDTVNADGDSLPDFCDACPLDQENDADGDGLCESDDNCETAANSDQADTDGDGAGDACDSDIDGDGLGNGDDNCVFDANSDQTDTDGDGAGDVCDMDLDGDGVLDADDACVPSSVGEVVNASGCGISSLCPCAHPDGGDKWKNHGAYVSCVAHAAQDFVDEGLMTETEKGVVVSTAGESSCGHKNQ